MVNPLKILKNSQGFALFLAIVVMAVIMVVISMNLFSTRVELKIASNLKNSSTAFYLAEAGLEVARSQLESLDWPTTHPLLMGD